MREAVAINPKVADYWYNLAVIGLAVDDRAGAREHFQRALELQPSDPRFIGAAHYAH